RPTIAPAASAMGGPRSGRSTTSDRGRGWIAPRRLRRRSRLEALASDLGLEGRADRLIETRRLPGGLLPSFLLDERIPLLRQLDDLLANLPALLDLLRVVFPTFIGRKPLELVSQI